MPGDVVAVDVGLSDIAGACDCTVPDVPAGIEPGWTVTEPAGGLTGVVCAFSAVQETSKRKLYTTLFFITGLHVFQQHTLGDWLLTIIRPGRYVVGLTSKRS